MTEVLYLGKLSDNHLNDSCNQNWIGDSTAYYGYDGGTSYGGSNSHSMLRYFEQEMVVLTMEDFLGYFSPEDFPKVDSSVFKATRPTNSFIINVPKL